MRQICVDDTNDQRCTMRANTTRLLVIIDHEIHRSMTRERDIVTMWRCGGCSTRQNRVQVSTPWGFKPLLHCSVTVNQAMATVLPVAGSLPARGFIRDVRSLELAVDAVTSVFPVARPHSDDCYSNHAVQSRQMAEARGRYSQNDPYIDIFPT